MPFDQHASDLTSDSFAMYDKDRMRLQREMQHDFDHASISSTSTVHNIRGATFQDNDSDDSLGIRASARGYRTGGNMLPTESPAIDSKMFSNQFADFSMDAGDFDDDSSVEIGRGSYRTALEGTPKESTAAANGRNARRSYPVDLFSPSPKAGRNAKRESVGAPQRKASNLTTPKRPTTTRDKKASNPGAVSKTTETLSRSPVPQQQDDTMTGFLPVDSNYTNNNNLRSSRRSLFQNIQKSPRPKHNDLAVPTSFKSTKDFIRELGLNGDTATVNLDARNQQLQQQDQPTATVDVTTQSFMIPDADDMSEVLGDITKQYGRKRRANGQNNSTYMPSPFHRPIESIPVPQDERATLMAMRELQEKMEGLEMENETLNRKSVDLERQYLLMKDKYQVEHKRVEMLQRELDNVRNGRGQNESDPRDQEKLNGLFSNDRMRLETTISNLRTRVDELTHQIELSRISLKNAQSERNAAVSQAADALASSDEQKSQNVALKKEIERLRSDRYQAEKRFEEEKSEWRLREERLRREARKDVSAQNFDVRRTAPSAREERDFEKEVREMVWRETRPPLLLPRLVLQSIVNNPHQPAYLHRLSATKSQSHQILLLMQMSLPRYSRRPFASETRRLPSVRETGLRGRPKLHRKEPEELKRRQIDLEGKPKTGLALMLKGLGSKRRQISGRRRLSKQGLRMRGMRLPHKKREKLPQG
ncbi:hypothetical protein BJ508DRAFT_379860 [Ascobolus immersus RN42]|uniref:PPC89 centrosome localisation domain-containing protein n=1 Tax=Ascobolus immersus RN42 TaxID=1160509 RepID=A0A3N4HVC4_ASCIM|nr:hypothetical protein BJ508DRAFT_379860 [Ascobolus immersus RN42]